MMKQNPLKGQTVFITGASSGIGKACAEHFAALGAHLILTARREERLKALANTLSAQHGVSCTPIQLDVRSYEQVHAVASRLAADKIDVDILVNNAGLALASDKVQEGKVSHWDTMIDTNIKGLLYVTRALLPFMLEKNRGHIINIGSFHKPKPPSQTYIVKEKGRKTCSRESSINARRHLNHS